MILRLGRLLDPHPAAISLGNLLQTIKENVGASSTLLPPTVANLDLSELGQDMIRVSDSDATVKKLLTLRNEYMVHRGSQHVARGTFAHLSVLDRDELALLLNRSLDTLQKYRDRLGFRPLGWGHHVVQDFETLLALLRAGLRAAR